MIIKLTLRKHWLRILFTSILFLVVITCTQLAINLSNSYLSIASRARKYNASHTEISVDLFYDQSFNITDFSEETKAFLDAFPDIEYYTAQVTLKRHFIRYEEYVDNNVDNYRVLAGKQLKDLELYEVAIPANINDYFLDSGETVYKLGDLITGLSEPLVVASIIDNIHFAESAFNELTMSEPGLSWDRSYEHSRFLTNRDTIDYINSQVGRIEVQSTAFKISYINYSVAEEQRLIDSYINYIGGMNSTIQILTFREVLQSANGSDVVIGKTLTICSTMMFVFAVMAIIISVKHDLVKDRRIIGTLRSIGISIRTIVMTYLSEYSIASVTGYLGSLLFFLMTAVIFRGQYRYSLFFSKDVTLYVIGFGVILTVLIGFMCLVGMIIGKAIDKKPTVFFRDYSHISRMSNCGNSLNLSKINIGIRYALADWFSSLQHLLSAILIVLSFTLFFGMNSYTKNIYTTNNFGLDYDYFVISKYDIYSEIMGTYGEKSLIVAPQEVWAIITDADLNEFHVKIFYVAYSGDICDFLASECELGSCPPNSTIRGQGLVGFALANDFNLEVAPSDDPSYMHFVRFIDTAVGTSSTYNIKIQGIQTILQHNGYVVYDRIGDEADYAGRRFLDYFEDNINRAQYYLKLSEEADRDELESFLTEQGVTFSSSTERESAIRDSSGKLVFYINSITSVSLVLTLLIFTYIMVNDFSYFYAKRKRDFGILRSLGFSAASSSVIFVSRYILLSMTSVFVGTLGTVLFLSGVATFISDAMGVFKVSSINEVMMAISIASVFFVMICLLMTLFAGRVSRRRIADLVRPEE